MSLAEFDEIDFSHTTTKLDAPSAYLLNKARRQNHGIENLRNSYKSSTIYVGNLSFYTTEEQIYELFSKAGLIKDIIMGLDRYNYTPCGFCFIIYFNPIDSINAVKFLNGTKLDDRVLQIDLDPGFREGRQFGRGVYGGQVRDEMRFEYDGARGGYGKRAQEEQYHQNKQRQQPGFGEPVNDENEINDTTARFGARRLNKDDIKDVEMRDEASGKENIVE